MGLINVRQALDFPSGDNATDTLINGVHLNITALDAFNYTYYANGTLSNNSKCYLIFDQFQPTILSNGSWINGTSCYIPYYGIRARGTLSIAFGVCFGMSIMFTLINLRKHGRMFIREDKRFRIVGRRWQWYWICFIAACALISCITGIDVDRYYLPSIPIILQGFFFYMMLPATLAAVWEATRHWGSWQERQIYDRDPFSLPQDDQRSRTEFYLPLVFYAFTWLNFFMVIPRSWTNIEHQRSAAQQLSDAKPSGTDARIKAGAVLAICAWLVIIFSLMHSVKHYKPSPAGFSGGFTKFLRYAPPKLSLTIIILGVRLGYGILSAWVWDTSILKLGVDTVWPFALGYAPILLIVIIFEVAGYVEENEDKVLLQQRRERGQSHDRELGLTQKPSWWRRLNGDPYMSTEQRLKALATEVGGTRNVTANTNVELTEMSPSADQGVRNRSRSRPRDGPDPFRDPSPANTVNTIGRSDAASTMTAATGMTGRTLTNDPPPQKIRSMLDV